MSEQRQPPKTADLEERFLKEILEFPGRIDAMEHRDEQSARKLAQRLAQVAREAAAAAAGDA